MSDSTPVHSQPAYDAVIPAPVRYDPRLKRHGDIKCLYGEIRSLCGREGYCWASNEYFSKTFSTSTRTITRWIGLLEKCGHITAYYDKKGMKQLRKIYLGNDIQKSFAARHGRPPRLDTDVHHGWTRMSNHEENNHEEIRTTTREAGGPAAAAAPLSEKKAEKKKAFIYAILDKIDIPHGTKVKLTNDFDEKTVINAIGWATHPSNPPRESLAASIRFACNEGLSAALFDKKKRTAQDIEQANKEFAMGYNGQEAGLCFVEALNQHVEICIGHPNKRFVLSYSEKGFIEQFTNALRKYGFKILEE